MYPSTRHPVLLLALVALPLLPTAGFCVTPPQVRARDLGVPYEGVPGPLNAITDIPGLEVGHTTLIRGEGPLVKGEGPVRTGVTAVLPRGHQFGPVFAATYALNGNGEMTGMHWIDESGFLETPILITNTFSVGVVRDAVIAWMDSTGYNADPDGGFWYTYPVVAETYDVLNDILGQHVTGADAFHALDTARGGAVAEGNVGGGTGMIAHQFKGGIGTASRLLPSGHTLGVLVQANYGGRARFSVAGVPVGKEISDLLPNYDVMPRGSIIVVVATDAPLMPHQLQRIAERVPLAIGRMGGLGENGSGDIFIAFSTGNEGAWAGGPGATLETYPNELMNPLFEATVQATEEAILNAMVAAETMVGRDGLVAHALPHDRLQAALQKHDRWVEPGSLPRAAATLPGDAERLVGRYRSDGPISTARLFVENGMLFFEARGRNRVVPLTDGRLSILGTPLQLGADPEDTTRIRVTSDDRLIAEMERIEGD